MNPALSNFAARLREAISHPRWPTGDRQFSDLALELFALQQEFNPAYRRICDARQRLPKTVGHWTQVPFVPTSAFKELELSSIPPAQRTAEFHSSGTTEQKPSRHFHHLESLATYEASLWHGFTSHFDTAGEFVFLTPPATAAPRSSLVHMFETVRRNVVGQGLAGGRADFFGHLAQDDSWTIDFGAVIRRLHSATDSARPLTILGTAFSFVHLLDFLAGQNSQLALPAGSKVMETGGYKNRSRVLPKPELHALITRQLGIGQENIVCEYGMSELSSQAYDSEIDSPTSPVHPRIFRFPPWARVQIISPETGREVAEGQTGLIRIFDLANVFSVAAIQTEDLGLRRGNGFEWIGRAQLAEARGCSLMTAQS